MSLLPEIVIFLLSASLYFYLALFSGVLLEGRLRGNRPSKDSGSFFSIILGFCALISVSGMLFFQGRTVATALFILLIIWVSLKWKSGVWRFNFRVRQAHLWFVGLLIFNLVVRYIFLYDFSNGKFHTLPDDQYSYLEQYVLMHRYGKEMHFLELENRVFGFAPDFKPYHYAEFYLTWLFDRKGSGLSDFKVFQLFTNSFLLTWSQLILAFLGQFLFPGRRLWQLILPGLLIFYACQHSVWFNVFFHFPIHNRLGNAAFFFPLQAISTDLFVSPVFPNSSIKLSGFFILLSLFTYAFRSRQKDFFILACCLTLVLNYAFAPFLVALSTFFLFQEKENWVWFGVFPGLLLIFLLVFGGSGIKTPVTGIQIIYDWNFNLSQTRYFLTRYLTNFIGNYYTLFLTAQFLIFFGNRNRLNLIFFGFALSFPFCFALSGSFQGVFLGIFILCFPIAWFLTFKNALSPRLFFPFFASVLLTGLVVFILREKQDFWQLFYYPFTGSLLFLLFLSIVRTKTSLLLSMVVLSTQLFANHMIFKRLFFRERSSQPIVKEFLSRIPQRITRTAYVSDPADPSFWVLEKTGFDIQNEFDSLFSTFISIENLNRQDTIQLLKRGNLSVFEHLPINRYRAEHPGLSIRQSQIGFLRDKGVSIVFRSYVTDRKHLDFLNPYLKDSLDNPVDHYRIYFLDSSVLNDRKHLIH